MKKSETKDWEKLLRDEIGGQIRIKDAFALTETEEKLQKSICEHMSIFYPHIYYFSDPSGIFASPRLRNLLHKTHSSHAQLDMIILEPSNQFNFLVLECKKETPYLKDGSLSTGEHIQKQKTSMDLLESKGGKCLFVWNLEQVKIILENYLGKSEVKDEPLF